MVENKMDIVFALMECKDQETGSNNEVWIVSLDGMVVWIGMAS